MLETGDISTLVGGTQDQVDGPLSSARVHAPYGISIDTAGTVFFTEQQTNCVRMITSDGRPVIEFLKRLTYLCVYLCCFGRLCEDNYQEIICWRCPKRIWHKCSVQCASSAECNHRLESVCGGLHQQSCPSGRSRRLTN